MRIISMVPSWTETLIEAGVEVVGRTRFCVHPVEKVKSIPVVGGTKDIKREKVNEIDFDFLLLDKEENPKSMAEQAERKVIATHITNCGDVIGELRSLSSALKNQNLEKFADRWEAAIQHLRSTRTANGDHTPVQLQTLEPKQLTKLGIQTWIRAPEQAFESIVYVIWKDPFMAVTKETFIGSMLELVGLPTSLSTADTQKLYPEIDLGQFDKNKTLFLFSSEPYPFHKKVNELSELNLSGAIINGESYSWFGLRALKFLENQLK